MIRADDGAPWLLGCVVATKTSTCLVNATVRDPPGGPVRVRQLCGMLTALHSLAGGIAEPVSFLTLSRFSVGLCESRDGYIVAVLADPGDAHRESVSELARVVARAFARAGGPDLPDLIHADILDAEERADAHTVHDDLADPHDEPRTWDRFASFHDDFLIPALRERRPARIRWLEPVAALPDVLRVHLLTLQEDEPSPSEPPESESPHEPTNATRANATTSTLSLPGAAASHPLAALAVAGAAAALWTAVKRHAAALIASAADRNRNQDRNLNLNLNLNRTESASASDSEVLAFDDVAGCAGATLRVAMRATPHPGAPRGYAVVAAFSASSPRGGAWGPSHSTVARDASAASASESGSGSGSESRSRSPSSSPAPRAGAGAAAAAGAEVWRAREAARRAAYPRSYVATRSAAAAPRALAEAFAETRRRVAEDHERLGTYTAATEIGAASEAPPPLPAREVHVGSPSERVAAAAEARARANAAATGRAASAPSAPLAPATPAAKHGFGTPSTVRVAVETPRNADGHGNTNHHVHGNESVEVVALPTARGGAKPPVRPAPRGGEAGDVLAESRRDATVTL
jgi:hypothetical protein